MPVKKWYQTIGAVGAAAAVVLAGCGSDEKKESSGDTLTRAASGDLATNGGARRENGDQTQAIRDAINGSAARNVIMLLGDGASLCQVVGCMVAAGRSGK